ncbi:endonuclease/exonuclease/phosphatase family protein [Quadrisphaera sp. KR29]|uniref:endonuclease/exonuclease/phosphatase family protein n=1 Tax=Quadrisphaera sp. KR29 TaxID=3461391 RepID=UPI00404464A4
MQHAGADPVDVVPRRGPSRPPARSAAARRPAAGGPGRRVLPPPVASAAALAVVGAALLTALLTALPGAAGLAGRVPLAQLLPFRGVLAIVLLAAALLVLAAAALLRLVRRRSRPAGQRARRGLSPSGLSPSGLRPSVLLATGLALAAVVHAGVLAHRGVLPPAAAPAAADLVVLALNTEHGGAAPGEVADAVARARADVVVLPETPAALAQQVVDSLGTGTGGASAYALATASTSPEPTHATSLLVAARLGAPSPAPAPEVALAAVAATTPELPGPVVAVHPIAPVPRGGMVERWRADVPRAVAACTASPGAVVAGDFNATLDHPALRDLGPCVDAAAAAGAGGLGTWPASVPALLSAPIDHVLVDERAWRVLSAEVVTVGASDHRGLVVHLARR